ncbi:Crp/Fnr family transcriptional regulator [Rhodoferax antarcticus]|uniref:Transcriptional regulator, Crp/Fnr family n=1 Tax=Rhodoferax antarcticus ANT.BR TaxID=1111071 RepID=A0A1Q8YIK3_9BURK|nr:Crp/Fnr family transcriptional regulator [Rhodoferax antarcticus]APW48570.1 Crp/Fnr family transcriptional regulator [Rhodoferax antarcticus]MCW2313885.1 CRP-like cAMP-binding protein [Rhodoferax antarcticus]OLP07842.1 transcriptional regulator, Crp/Fnr family [Rhodoferax antarcticus ANT.BR]
MHIHSGPTGDPRQNHFLAALPESVWTRWRGQLEIVDLPVDKQLYTSTASPAYVYFPTTAIVSLLYFTREGVSTEICAVGNDGVIGMDSVMGSSTTATEAVVQSAGIGYRLSAQTVRKELSQGGPALPMLLRYAHSQVAQISQMAVCNHFHSVEQKFCRRLLIGLDRSTHSELSVTHEQFSNLLGVRRESITAAAHKLQLGGVIRYSRGRVTVLDRHRLERGACECYAAAKNQYERTMPMPLPLAA